MAAILSSWSILARLRRSARAPMLSLTCPTVTTGLSFRPRLSRPTCRVVLPSRAKRSPAGRFKAGLTRFTACAALATLTLGVKERDRHELSLPGPFAICSLIITFS